MLDGRERSSAALRNNRQSYKGASDDAYGKSMSQCRQSLPSPQTLYGIFNWTTGCLCTPQLWSVWINTPYPTALPAVSCGWSPPENERQAPHVECNISSRLVHEAVASLTSKGLPASVQAECTNHGPLGKREVPLIRRADHQRRCSSMFRPHCGTCI